MNNNWSCHEKRGFVTVATGDEKYYQLASNLLLSYRTRGQGKYPFALICDRENEYTAAFDHIVLTQDFCRGTVDKLLLRLSPYEESIFIDADTLLLENVDDLWNVFSDSDDMSMFGKELPLDSQDGWFTWEGSGKYKDRIEYLISMNGGIYYFRNTQLGRKVLETALLIMDDYSDIDFKYFSTPQDEPLVAMSMVLNGCKPCEKEYPMIILPACSYKVTVDWHGNVYENKLPSKAKMIHFSTRRTNMFLYHYLNDLNRGQGSKEKFFLTNVRYAPEDIKFNLFHTVGAILRKNGMDSLVNKLKKILR